MSGPRGRGAGRGESDQTDTRRGRSDLARWGSSKTEDGNRNRRSQDVRESYSRSNSRSATKESGSGKGDLDGSDSMDSAAKKDFERRKLEFERERLEFRARMEREKSGASTGEREQANDLFTDLVADNKSNKEKPVVVAESAPTTAPSPPPASVSSSFAQ